MMLVHAQCRKPGEKCDCPSSIRGGKYIVVPAVGVKR